MYTINSGCYFLLAIPYSLIFIYIYICTAKVGKKFKGQQWRAMILQACGMIVVQYDPCKATRSFASHSRENCYSTGAHDSPR